MGMDINIAVHLGGEYFFEMKKGLASKCNGKAMQILLTTLDYILHPASSSPQKYTTPMRNAYRYNKQPKFDDGKIAVSTAFRGQTAIFGAPIN